MPDKLKACNVTKVFGPDPQRALPLIREGVCRQEIMDRTGLVVGVDQASFSVAEGEIFVIMGLSGSGKSTLLRCINRLIEPTDGQLWFNGQDVFQMSPRELREFRRQKVSMVFQNWALFPHYTVIQNVEYGLAVQGVDARERRKRAREALEMVGLAGWESHIPTQLSGGMQQRVGLARALVSNPEILLMDEAFSALDPLIRQRMQEELMQIQSQMRKTIIFITHDLQEAIHIGDHVAVMNEGRIVQLGTPEDIVLYPADEYVAAFTQGVDRSQFLRARHCMRPARDGEVRPGGPQVIASTLWKELLKAVLQHKEPLAVVDDEGRPLGVVDKETVLARLSEEGGIQHAAD